MNSYQDLDDGMPKGWFTYSKTLSLSVFLTAFLSSFLGVISHKLPLMISILLCIFLGMVTFFMGMVVGICRDFEEVQLAKSRLLVSEIERRKENEKKSHID